MIRIHAIAVMVPVLSLAIGLMVVAWSGKSATHSRDQYHAALIEADKNYRAALREDMELMRCREALEMIIVMEAM